MKFYRAILHSLVCVFMFSLAIAQKPNSKIDSLENWLAKYPQKDTVWVNNALAIEKLYSQMSPDKQGAYASEIIKVSQKMNFIKGLAMAQTYIARKYIQQGKYLDATQAVIAKISYDKKLNDNFELGSSYSLLGYINALTSNYTKSLEYYFLSKSTAEKLPANYPNKILTLVGLNVNLASTYSAIGEHKKALASSLEALQLLRIKVKEKSVNTLFTEVAILQSVGIDYSRLGEFQKSNSYLLEGLKLVENNNIQSAFARYYAAICDNYIKLNELEKAVGYINHLKEMFDKKKLDSDEIALYLAHRESFSLKKNDYKEAYNWIKQSTAHLDSVKGTEQQNKIKELSVQYETKEKEAKIKHLEHAEELANTRNRNFMIVTVLLSLLLGVACLAIWQVRKAKRKVEEANTLRDTLFSVVTHDLRSPVASLRRITSKIDFVLKKNDPKATRLLSTAIEDSATSLYTLVDNLLHWLLLQQGKIKYNPSRFVLTDEIREVIQSLQYKANIKNIKLELAETADIEVEVDRMFVQTILRNLIDNALKFTPEGGIVGIKLVTLKNNIEIYVSDTGSGIAKEIQDILFKEAISNKPANDKGKGVGLYLCAELAKASASSLKLLSSTSAGSIFVYSLPLNK